MRCHREMIRLVHSELLEMFLWILGLLVTTINFANFAVLVLMLLVSHIWRRLRLPIVFVRLGQLDWVTAIVIV